MARARGRAARALTRRDVVGRGPCAKSGPQSESAPALSGAIGAVVARFVHTEEVTGSNPVSPTSITAGQRRFSL